MSNPILKQAVVIGAGMRGLAAAKAVAPHFEKVVVFDRDALPDAPEPRPGTPQARHTHGLLRQAPRVFVLFREGHKLRVEGGDSFIQLEPLGANVLDQQAHPLAQAFPVLSFRQAGKALFEAAFALWNDDPALQKDGAQLVDQSRPTA
jgi:hypothetical protein